MASGAWIVIVILVLLVGGVNLAMYGIARGAFRADNKSAWDMLGKSLNTAQKKDESLEELRRRMAELEKAKKE